MPTESLKFFDFIHLVQGFGFIPLRTSGSHHIFGRPDVEELVNIQDVSRVHFDQLDEKRFISQRIVAFQLGEQ